MSISNKQPYNLFTKVPYKHSRVASPMLEFKNKYGFTSLGFCTKKQAESRGQSIRWGEASRYAYIEFENGRWAKFYNEDQVE